MFAGYTGDAAREVDPYTRLRFKVQPDRIDLANIHVEPLLAVGVWLNGWCELSVTRTRASRMSFSGTTEHSRRLARKLAQKNLLFDARAEIQQFHYQADHAQHFYDEVPPRP